MNKVSTIAFMRRLLIRTIAYILITTISACTNYSLSTIDRSGLVDVAEITQNPEEYIGNSVLVRNDVLEIIGKRGLILDKDRVFIGDNILVINMSELPPTLSSEGTPEVLIHGTVERLDLNDLEQKYNLNLDLNLYTQYRDRPVIIADYFIFSPDPEDLTRNPQAYYNEPLAIKGELEDIKSYGVFELDEEQVFGGEDLIVVQPKPRIELHDEQTVIVYGKLRPFIVVELERDYDLDWDLSIEREIEAEYSQKPVFVADRIQILH